MDLCCIVNEISLLYDFPVHVVIFIIMIIYVHIRMLGVLYVRTLNF